MGYTLYDGTITVAQGILTTLSHILHQAEKHPQADTLLSARLHSDMYPLPDQIRLATQYCENIAARLTAREPVTFAGSPTTFSECFERIETVLKTLKEADKETVNGQGDVVAMTKMGPKYEVEMSAAKYVHLIALPNVYFHVTTAYGILRKEGVGLGKLDYYTGLLPLIAGNQ
ncbi:uncharacterized protein LY89DRAFT_687217 [Mollisia scopiformis]|uniref:DUF1993 domain-containing protein n=1 Tax=Mollisia scopiformis TaxID=149040 RepID=A0A194X111_MOLSC|nr:uncharacterized protein LY89DRAFT_687217 [Mollisia scopiformis]KUJ13880.1 hypothetical protein LY89DRAFT_687217 [Mollisia scopiformis]